MSLSSPGFALMPPLEHAQESEVVRQQYQRLLWKPLWADALFACSFDPVTVSVTVMDASWASIASRPARIASSVWVAACWISFILFSLFIFVLQLCYHSYGPMKVQVYH